MLEIENIEIFSGLSQEELGVLQSHMATRTYPKNSIVINEGDEANSLYVILSGSIRVYLSNEDGKEITINTQEAGAHFGELALLDESPRSASVITTDKTRLGVISKTDFKNILFTHPNLAFHLIVYLTKRVRLLSDNIKTLALLDVYGRVAKTLLELASDENGILVINNKPTQQDIANRIGASREMVAKIMKDLSIGGYITVDSKTITINEQLPHAY